MNLTLRGRLESRNGGLLTNGYRVTAAFTQLLHLGEADNARTPVPTSRSADVATSGAFTIDLVPKNEIEEPIALTATAPDGTSVGSLAVAIGAAEQPIAFEVSDWKPFVATPSDDPTLGRIVRLTGRVLDDTGRKAGAGLIVVIWGVKDADEGEGAIPLVIAKTQKSGYFAGTWPADVLASAFGTVADSEMIAIPLRPDRRLPPRIVLVTRLAPPSEKAEDDCSCDEGPPRAPDTLDLIANPSAYSTDLGGGRCVNLNTPNRVLEEFSYFKVVRTSQPVIKGISSPYATVVSPSTLSELRSLAAADPAAGRSRAIPDDMTIDPSVAKRLLAFPENITERSLAGADLSSSFERVTQTIQAVASPVVDRETKSKSAVAWDSPSLPWQATTVAHGHLLHLKQTWRADGYSLGDLLYSLPLAPCQKKQIAVVDWERRETAVREERLEEEEALASLMTRDRDVSEIVGSALRQNESGGSSTSMWGAGGGAGVGFIGTGFGIFAGGGGGAGGADSSAWSDSSRSLSASSLQQIRDNTMQSASAVRDQRSTVVQSATQGETMRAVTEVVANHNHCHAITIEYFEVLRHFQLTHELVDVQECLFIPLLMTFFDEEKALRWREVLEGRLLDRSLRGAFDSVQRVRSGWLDSDTPANRYSEEAPEELEGELRISFILPRPRDDSEAGFRPDAWLPYQPLFWTSAFAWWIARLERLAIADRDRIFQQEAAPRLAENLVQRLRFAYVTSAGGEIEISLDATLVSRYVEGVPLYITVRPSGGLPSIPREEISRFRIWYDGELPPDARVMVESGAIRYRTPHLRSFLFNEPRILNDLASGDDIVVATPVSQQELRSPREQDRERSRTLIAHLNKHLELFHQYIFRSFHPNHRYMLLDGFEAPDANGWSLASVVENRLIGILGNCLVMPVARGRHLDPVFNQDVEKPVDLLAHYAPTEALPATRLSVPTRGVYAEAVMGDCNSCEKKDESRFWRWDESPCPDEPTPIDPVSTASRALPAPDVRPTPLPEPIINIQNAPSLPDPAGLGQALELLGRADLFKDVTGLAGNQRNALAALQGALNTAKFFGGKAADFAMQQETSRNIDRTLQSVEQARSAGLLSDSQASGIVESALESMVGMGRPAAQAPQDSPSVQRAIDAATQSSSGEVSVTTPVESVHASFENPEPAGSEGTVGNSTVVKFADFSDWSSMGLCFAPGQAITGGVFRELAADARLSALQDQYVLDPSTLEVKLVGHSIVQHGVLARIDPTDATRYQFRVAGHICYPIDPSAPQRVAGTAPVPVVVLLHGNHEALQYATWTSIGTSTVSLGGTPATVNLMLGTGITEVASHRGYEDLQRELARNGIVSISVNENLANELDLRLQSRADMLLATLDAWKRQVDSDPNDPCHGRLDFNRVGLMGHSRGGDAVVRAAKDNEVRTANQFGIRAVCSLSPTDFTGSASNAMILTSPAPPAAVTDLVYLVLYGSLDGDVAGWSDNSAGPSASFTGTGFGHYDRATCHKAMIFVKGACHNRFNTNWGTELRVDPLDPDLLSPSRHLEVERFYVGGFFRWMLGGAASLRRRFIGEAPPPHGVTIAPQWSLGDEIRRIDTFEDPASNEFGTARVVPSGSVIRFRDLIVNGTPQGRFIPHPTFVLDANLIGPVAGPPTVLVDELPLPVTPLSDWSAFTALTFRIAQWFDVTGTIARRPLLVRVRIRDVANQEALASEADFLTPTMPGLPWRHRVRKFDSSGNPAGFDDLTLLRLETVRIPLTHFRTRGVDLTAVRAIAIDLDPSNGTHVFIDSLEIVRL